MATNQEITALTALTTPADGDVFPIVDISDTTDSADGTTKKIAISSLFVTGSKSTTFTWDGTGTPGTSSAITVRFQKIGDYVTIFIPVCIATTGTDSKNLISNTAIDATYRPTNAAYGSFNTVYNNGAAVDGNGVIYISSAGIIYLSRDNATTSFTNNAVAGSDGRICFTYYVGTGS